MLAKGQRKIINKSPAAQQIFWAAIKVLPSRFQVSSYFEKLISRFKLSDVKYCNILH